MRYLVWILPLILGIGTATAQQMGHLPMPGINANRDSYQSYLSSFKPPFEFVSSLDLEVNNARDFFSIENDLLVRRSTSGYQFYSRNGVAHVLWERATADQPCPPAYSRGIVIMQSSTTASVQAVALNGTQLWSGPSVGEKVYPPLAAGDAVFFHGDERLVAARIDSGQVLWQYEPPAGLAYSPLSMSNNLLFVLDKAGALHALGASTGEEVWATAGVGTDGSDVIATPTNIFVSSVGKIVQVETRYGWIRWTRDLPTNAIPNIALAYGMIYAVFPTRELQAYEQPATNYVVAFPAYNSGSGWEFREEVVYPDPCPVCLPPPILFRPTHSPIRDLFVADGLVYFLNESKSRVRALDAKTGALVWSLTAPPGVRAMTALNGEDIVLLRSDRVDSYRRGSGINPNQLYFPDFACGQGYSVRVTINNSFDQAVGASVYLYSAAGDELTLKDSGGEDTPVHVLIPPFSSVTVVIPDDGQPVRTGWARVASRRPVTASLVYQYAPGGVLLNEVGIADSEPTDFANIKVTHGAGFSTAAAILVAGEQEAHLSVQLLDNNGEEVIKNEITLGGHAQTARFFNEFLYPGVSFSEFDGTLVIRADQPIVVIALRTKDGTPISSFPVGTKR